MFVCLSVCSFVLVMDEGPAVGQAGNCLDWIARGLEMNVVKDFGGTPVRLRQGPVYLFCCNEFARLSNQLGSSSGIH